jgi:hypothetical protein
MRNRSGPSLSLRATGVVVGTLRGSEIVLTLSRPPIPDPVGIMMRRYDRDLEVMLTFLERTVGARPPGASQSLPS